MRGVGGELPLDAEALLQTVERLVHRVGQGDDLVGQSVGGQAHLQALRPDPAGHVGRLADRRQRPAHDDEVDPRQDQQDRDDQPRDLLQEGRDDVVHHHVRMPEVLGHLHPRQLPAAALGEAAAVVDRRAVGPVVEVRARRRGARGEQRAVILQGREQHPPLGVEDGVGEARGGLGVFRP